MTSPQTPLGRAQQLPDRGRVVPFLPCSLFPAHFVHAPDFVKCFIKGLQNRRRARGQVGAGRRDRPASTAARRVAASGSCVRVCDGIKSNGVVMEKGGGGGADVNGEERRGGRGTERDGIECIIHEKERIRLWWGDGRGRAGGRTVGRLGSSRERGSYCATAVAIPFTASSADGRGARSPTSEPGGAPSRALRKNGRFLRGRRKGGD